MISKLYDILIVASLGVLFLMSFTAPAEVVQIAVTFCIAVGLALFVNSRWGDLILSYIGVILGGTYVRPSTAEATAPKQWPTVTDASTSPDADETEDQRAA